MQLGGRVITSGYNSTQFSNTAFSIYKPLNSYTPPTTLSNSSIPGSLSLNSSVANCTIDISGGNQTPVNNVNDFSVTLVPINAMYPYWTAPTQFNCTVNGYSSNRITFNTKPVNITGRCKLAVIVRSSEGTGVISTQLLDSVIYYIKRSFTFTGTLNDTSAGNLVITISFPTGLSSGTETIKVYYSASNADGNPTLCSSNSGTIINSSGISTVSCAIPSGGDYYLYIKLSDDSFTNFNVSSTQITVSSNTRFKYIKDTGITSAQGGTQNVIPYNAGSYWYAAYKLKEDGSQKPNLSLTIVTTGPLLPSSGVDNALVDISVGVGDPGIHYVSGTVYGLGDGKVSASCSGVSTSSNSTIVFTATSSSAGTLSVNGTTSVQTFSMWSTGGDYVTVAFHPAVLSAEFRWW